MTTPVDPMPGLRAIVAAAAPDLTTITVGAVSGKEVVPFANIRSTGGPEEEAQVPEAERRIDVNVFAKDHIQEANRLSNLIHAAIQPPGCFGWYNCQLPNIFQRRRASWTS